MSILRSCPPERIRRLGASAPNAAGDYVLYWMVAQRRTRWSFALQRAAAWARELDRPLLVLEALRVDYRWASDRLHRFVLDGMRDNRRALAARGVGYHPYVEPEPGAGRGLLAALAERACAVVTDDWPCSFVPRMVEAAAARSPVAMEAVDSNGLLPLRTTARDFATAHAFRRHLQRELPRHLACFPEADPLRAPLRPAGPLPPAIARRWPRADDALLAGRADGLARLPIDHAVAPVATRGGSAAAEAALTRFLEQRLARYAERNQPDAEAASGLSPWLHFGHVSAHEVFARVAEAEAWSPERVSGGTAGAREGWWGMSPAAEAFVDQLVTWRELGFQTCLHRPDYDRYESLPDWARRTLAEHADDPRDPLYSALELEQGRTHDALWNAAQAQLVREGVVHNYLRMLWGKKVLEWSASPREALDTLIRLNDKHALDGRDPNSYSGIAWTLGRYDRPWAPERPIFGRVRWMSSQNTARKLRVKGYLARYADAGGTLFER